MEALLDLPKDPPIRPPVTAKAGFDTSENAIMTAKATFAKDFRS
jgi:hypothetical protein